MHFCPFDRWHHRRDVGRRATQVTNDHMRLVIDTSDEVVAPGTVFSLHVDVEPGDGMHV